ncbi:MAG: acyltransferase [Frankiales bacterium]|nr:acyltransferase [Frankiales bacterium]
MSSPGPTPNPCAVADPGAPITTSTATAGAPDLPGGLESAPAQERPGRWPCVEGMRGLAALTVVLTHAGFDSGESLGGLVGAPLARFDIGVALFFLLSGLLLGAPYARAAHGEAGVPSLRRYAARRAARLLPAYWIVVTAVLLVLRPDGIHSAGDLLWQYGLGQTYDHYRLLTGLKQMWSLGTELAFYAVLPCLGLVLRRLGSVTGQLLLLAGLSGFSLGWIALVHDGRLLDPQLAGQWLPAHLLWFSLGLALAVLTTRTGAATAAGRAVASLATSPGTCWATAGLAFWIACTPLTGPRGLTLLTASEAVSRELLYGLAAALLLVPVAAGPQDQGLLRAVLRSRPAVLLGRVSYGLFLWHVLVLELVADWFDLPFFHGRFLFLLGTVLPISLALATASWWLVERPLLRAVDRRLGAAGA